MTNEEYERTKDIPKAVRESVLRRDRWRCRRCGSEENLTLHHVVPRSRGGKHLPDNLVTVCWYKCHRLLEDREIIVKLIKGNWYFSN
jgi:5-methylcytosine-specific restriction endonuclease McrA